MNDESELRTELVISEILRWGVRVSLALILLGIVVFFVKTGDFGANGTPAETAVLISGNEEPFPLSLKWMFGGLFALNGTAIIVLGLALLIATPVIRVIAALVSFAIRRDRAFTAISGVVLLLVVLSFLLGLSL